MATPKINFTQVVFAAKKMFLFKLNANISVNRCLKHFKIILQFRIILLFNFILRLNFLFIQQNYLSKTYV